MKKELDGARAARMFAPTAAILAMLFLCGCADLEDSYLVDSVVTQNNDATLGHRGKQKVPVAFDLDSSTLPSGAKYAGIVTTKSKDGRNELAWHLINNSNEICEVHKGSITADANAIDFGFTQTSTVLSALGGILTGGSTTRILSGSAAAVDAMEGNTHDAFYQDKLASAITKSIDAERAKLLSAIQAGLQKDYDAYTVDQMIVDLVNYHQQCSFYSGVNTLAAAADRLTPTSDQLRKKLDELLATEEDLAAGSGTQNQSATSSLQSAIDTTAVQLQKTTLQ